MVSVGRPLVGLVLVLLIGLVYSTFVAWTFKRLGARMVLYQWLLFGPLLSVGMWLRLRALLPREAGLSWLMLLSLALPLAATAGSSTFVVRIGNGVPSTGVARLAAIGFGGFCVGCLAPLMVALVQDIARLFQVLISTRG